MSLLTVTGRDAGGLVRDQGPGDLQNTNEVPQTLNNAAGVTLTASQLMAGILLRTGPAGAFGDTMPTAAQIIAGMLSQANYQGSGASTPLGINVGSSFRLLYHNGGGGLATPVVNTGVTFVGTTTVASTSWKEYLVRVTNGTPQQIFSAVTVNGSAVITGLTAEQTKQLSPGMLVSGAGIQAGSLIVSVQPGVGVTLSLTATADAPAPGAALTFNPTVVVQSLGTRTV